MTELKKIYEFGDFRLDTARETLQRDGANISITRKMFETLLILVQNADRLVEKQELMQRIWHDRFVEESNLTFNIKMLRKALGDSAAQPTYIETIPRRGYRFISEVRERDPETKPVADTPVDVPATSRAPASSRRPLLFAAVAAIVLVGSLTFASLLWQKGYLKANNAIFPNGFLTTRVSETGKVYHAVISPDGKYVAYSNIINGKQSLWLRHLESASNTPVLPPSDDVYYGLAFAGDGQSFYFVRGPDDDVSPSAIYRIPIFGGVPEKIVESTQGWISVSPSDGRISFVRTEKGPIDSNSLFVVDADGANVREVTRSAPTSYFWANSFSPDGKKIAVAYGDSSNASQNIGLCEVDVETGAIRELSSEKFFHIRSLAWTPDGRSILFSADKRIGETIRISQLDLDTGRIQVVTNDLISYDGLSVTRDAKLLLATTLLPDFYLWVRDPNEASGFKKLTQARDRFAFTPDGKIVYASDAAGNEDIWTMDADGHDQRQLTNDQALDYFPIVSSHGRYVYFTSNRTGESQVWRMHIDGSDQTQITRTDGGYPLFATPDNKFLYYQAARSGQLMKVSLEDGQATAFGVDTGHLQAFSPNGRLIVYLYIEKPSDRTAITLLDVETKQPVRRFSVPTDRGEAYFLRWQDDEVFGYSMNAKDAADSIWVQNIKEDAPRLLHSLDDDGIADLQFSKDGKSIGYIRGNWSHDAVLFTSAK